MFKVQGLLDWKFSVFFSHQPFFYWSYLVLILDIQPFWRSKSTNSLYSEQNGEEFSNWCKLSLHLRHFLWEIQPFPFACGWLQKSMQFHHPMLWNQYKHHILSVTSELSKVWNKRQNDIEHFQTDDPDHLSWLHVQFYQQLTSSISLLLSHVYLLE